jgi:superfamily I DNA/RNA helicase
LGALPKGGDTQLSADVIQMMPMKGRKSLKFPVVVLPVWGI